MPKPPLRLDESSTNATGQIQRLVDLPEPTEGFFPAKNFGEGGPVAIGAVMRTQISGPIPSASEFAAYGAALESAPDRILSMAERQQRHDHWVEAATLFSESFYRALAMLAGAGVLIYMIYGVTRCALEGQYVSAIGLGAATALTSIAGIFIRGRDLTAMKKATEAPNQKPTTKAPTTGHPKRPRRKTA